jgi:hypothetical protein
MLPSWPCGLMFEVKTRQRLRNRKRPPYITKEWKSTIPLEVSHRKIQTTSFACSLTP